MKIVDLNIDSSKHLDQAAKLLMECFEGSWSTYEEAMEEVHQSLGQGKISRVAIDEEDNLLGWIGGMPSYGGRVWELHPLAVCQSFQYKGIGTLLVEDFEEKVAERGGITVMLGTDDENNRTSLGGIDIYTNLYDNIKNIKNLGRHPFEFYKKLGYVIVGVVPDANGFGKPDIMMAKRVGK